MTTHVYWRQDDYPLDPFRRIGECDAVWYALQVVELDGEPIDMMRVELRGYAGRPVRVPGSVARRLLPPGAYELASDEHLDQDVVRLEGATAIGDSFVLLVMRDAMFQRERGLMGTQN